MLKDGLHPAIQHATTRDEIRRLMPEVEEVYRARDADLNRRCALDSQTHGAFFRRVVDTHASRQEVCLTTLTLSGSLAAYVLCFLDEDVYRMWNCRFNPRFARYSAGMVAMDASVENALMTGCRVYDFMRGEEPYKASYANYVARANDLRAWSGPLLERTFQLWCSTRVVAEKWEREQGARGQLIAATRKVAERLQAR
jgi:CelD/BcsL family acetyltransferase involved in cellulose biosynthesis